MRNTLIGLAIGLLLAAGVFFALDWYSNPEPAVQAQPAPELKGEATAKLECKPVLVFRDKVKEELGVPDAPNRHVVAATQVPGDEHPRTITATFNDRSGEVTQFVRRDPLQWFDTRHLLGIGLSYGIGSEHDAPTAKLDGYWQPLKMKALTFRVTGDVTSDGQWAVWGRTGLDFTLNK